MYLRHGVRLSEAIGANIAFSIIVHSCYYFEIDVTHTPRCFLNQVPYRWGNTGCVPGPGVNSFTDLNFT